MIDTELLSQFLSAYFPQAPQTLPRDLDRYGELLVEWNEKMNLTAITQGREMTVKHFIDSLTPALTGLISPQDKLVDVGTGAGFPGVPLALLYPSLSLTLMDSLGKRVTFLQALTGELSRKADCIHIRAEEAGQNPLYREQFDVATARAVAALPVLCEYCLPLVKVGGVFLAMKGPEIQEELEGAKNAMGTLGGKLEKLFPFTLPDGSGRTIAAIRKISPTKPAYPRNPGRMKKKPL